MIGVRVRIVTVTLAGVLAVAGCSAGRASAPALPTTTRTTPTSAPATSTTLPPYVSLTARAVVPHLAVFRAPNARSAELVLDNPWRVDPSQPSTAVPQVFLVEAQRRDGWVRLLLPVRPNDTSAWVRAADVALSPVAYKIVVQLGAHRITVFDQGAAAYSGPIADGKPSTPTPTGRYYIRVLIKAPDANTVYGPYAYGLSSHSNVLTTFEGGDGEIGIHGNDDASVLGKSVTHGCIRIDNVEITRLAAILPLGTPVDIEP